jgi:hypothetical protein
MTGLSLPPALAARSGVIALGLAMPSMVGRLAGPAQGAEPIASQAPTQKVRGLN